MKKNVNLPKRRIFLDKNPSVSNIFSPEEFKALVKYERTRSDRNGSAFSVTVFSPEETGPRRTNILVEKIARSSRSIDCVGWGDNGRIAVLLPDTMRQGADVFGKKVLNQLEKGNEDKLSFDVYSYPENWLYSETNRDPFDSVSKEVGNHQAADFASVKNGVEYLFVQTIPVWKRAVDTTGSFLLLVLTSPLLLFMALFIKLVSPGPVLFHQTRIGYKGIPFKFWKFRTMKCDNNQSFHGKHAQNFIVKGDIPMEKLDNHDPRIIFGGKVIRKCCVDELPQLWNVLKGDMSLVGPRPCIPYEAKEYLRWHTHRFDVLPGLTGLWQVSGKNKLTFKQMIRLDIQYCQNISFLGDLAIILRTPLAILKMVFEAFVGKVSERVEKYPIPAVGKKFQEGNAINTLGNVLSSRGGAVTGSER